MRVYRLEHYGCAYPGHGPFGDPTSGRCCESAPPFGGNGSPPDAWPKWRGARCAVLPEHLALWFRSQNTADDVGESWAAATHGWQFVEWETGGRKTYRASNDQVVFDQYVAYPVRLVPWSEVLDTLTRRFPDYVPNHWD